MVARQRQFEARPETVDRESRQQRIRAVLMTYAEPQPKYDGMSAWEMAGKILAVLDEAGIEKGTVPGEDF